MRPAAQGRSGQQYAGEKRDARSDEIPGGEIPGDETPSGEIPGMGLRPLPSAAGAGASSARQRGDRRRWYAHAARRPPARAPPWLPRPDRGSRWASRSTCTRRRARGRAARRSSSTGPSAPWLSMQRARAPVIGRTKFFSSRNWKKGVSRPWPNGHRKYVKCVVCCTSCVRREPTLTAGTRKQRRQRVARRLALNVHGGEDLEHAARGELQALERVEPDDLAAEAEVERNAPGGISLEIERRHRGSAPGAIHGPESIMLGNP